MAVIDDVKANRRRAKAALEALAVRMAAMPASGARSVQPKFDAGVSELENFDARIEELQEQELREARAAAHRVEMGVGGDSGGRFYTHDSDVYSDPHRNPDSPSFFRDMRDARLGNCDAADRLGRNQQARASENRAISTVAGAGGQFAPRLAGR